MLWIETGMAAQLICTAGGGMKMSRFSRHGNTSHVGRGNVGGNNPVLEVRGGTSSLEISARIRSRPPILKNRKEGR